MKLCCVDLVEVVCGFGGGYCLVYLLSEICVVDILGVVDEIVSVMYKGVGVSGGVLGSCV